MYGGQLIVTDVTDTVPAVVSVEIVDTTAPTLAPEAWPRMLWPPNGELKEVTVWANAFDNGGGAITLGVTVESQHPQPDDHQIVSIDNETGVIELLLRASTRGRGRAKIYKVIVTATDESGNVSTARVRVLAPRRGWRRWWWWRPCH